MKKTYLFLALLLSLSTGMAQTITFEDLSVPPGGYWKGVWPTSKDSGFQSGPGFFVNSWDTTWGGSWSGWGFSNRKDTVSLSYSTNELASIANGGRNGSNNYAVAYQSYNPAINIVRFPSGYQMGWAYLTNTTIAYRSMQNGDGFGKKFGGASGTDPDFFKVRFTGWFNGSPKNDTVDFYLADFRDSNSANDYIVKDWTLCNLSALGYCDSLTFVLSSSDTGAFGMNTPAYFCLDDVTMMLTSTEDWQQETGISLYPQPAGDKLMISVQGDAVQQARIMSATGQTMQSFSLAPHQTTEIPCAHWAPGMYFLEVKGSKTRVATQILKQ